MYDILTIHYGHPGQCLVKWKRVSSLAAILIIVESKRGPRSKSHFIIIPFVERVISLVIVMQLMYAISENFEVDFISSSAIL